MLLPYKRIIYESDAAAGITNITAAVDLGGGTIGVVSQQLAMGIQAPAPTVGITIIISYIGIRIQLIFVLVTCMHAQTGL